MKPLDLACLAERNIYGTDELVRNAAKEGEKLEPFFNEIIRLYELHNRKQLSELWVFAGAAAMTLVVVKLICVFADFIDKVQL